MRSLRALGALGAAAFAMLVAGGAAAKKFPWQRDPGPIAGRWKVSCQDSEGMVIEVSQRDGNALGVVVALGNAGKFGYKQGEEVFRLKPDDFGDWVGQLKWRGRSGTERWDPIRLVATPTTLNATMTTDACYKSMSRVR
jgi:hypothetical protein